MTKGKRIYVLDTNVLMHDPTALFKFHEHDVFLPMQVIENSITIRKERPKARATPGRLAVFSMS